ncbi:hypothetical protein KSS87_011294 [Heliosperma pusillum]|nr:hypothetical protein KSS87_011294 [Heliosperma pusillum]
MGDVNPDFIQTSDERPSPGLSVQDQDIPVINISSPLTNQVIRDIKEACQKWGFFQIIGHGVPPEKRHKVELTARQFFALPPEEKNKVCRNECNPLGYYDSEHTKNVRDWKQIFDFTVLDPTKVPASHLIQDEDIIELRNQWPLYPSHFRAACEEYTQEMVTLSFMLLELIALSLGLSSDRLSGYFKDHASFVRINYYPSCPFPHLALGVGRHKDSGALTVLAQDDVGGLEVKRKTDGEWIPVKPIPDAYIINVGDVIQVWSNDRYESVEHRVKVNPEKERLSIPFFFNPSHYVMVKPLDELFDKQENAKYKGYNYGKFYTRRRLSDFKKLSAENVQIHHFRIRE